MVKAYPLSAGARTAMLVLLGLNLIASAGCMYALPDTMNSVLADLVMGRPGFSPFTIRVINETGWNAELDLEIDGVPQLAPLPCTADSFRCDSFLNELPRQVSLLEMRLYDDQGIQIAGQDFRGIDAYTFNWPIDFRYRSTLMIYLTTMGADVEIVF